MDVARENNDFGSPGIDIGGFASLGNGAGPFSYRNYTYQPVAMVSFNKGKHFMKVGGELRTVRMDSVGPLGGDGGTRGAFAYNNAQWTGIEGVANTGHTIAAFLQGLATQKTRLVGDFRLNYTLTRVGRILPGRLQGFT